MKITRNQANMLADLSSQIQQHYGFNIGYLNPAIPMPMDPSIDFLILEHTTGEDDLQCFHRGDIADRTQGHVIVRTINSDPEHDAKVKELFNRLNDDLLSGILTFAPGVTREVEGMTVSITKKYAPKLQKDVFDTNLYSEQFGTVYTYPIICEQAKIDRKFQIAKDIIDELWPQPKPKKQSPNWFTKFKKWFL